MGADRRQGLPSQPLAAGKRGVATAVQHKLTQCEHVEVKRNRGMHQLKTGTKIWTITVKRGNFGTRGKIGS